MTRTKFVVRCLDHPTYSGRLKPKWDCHTCDVLWNMENNPEYPVCGIDLLVQQEDLGFYECGQCGVKVLQEEDLF